MDENRSKGNNVHLIKDPNLIKNRIFLGNIPECTKNELESIAQPYGNVLGSMIQKNFGFIQFESEEIAHKAAKALHRSTFKGKSIIARNAYQNKLNHNQNNGGTNLGPPQINQPVMSSGADINDCEIIVVNKRNTEYAEFVEDKLKHKHLRVDLLFPNEDVPIGKVLASISSRGCLYAILVAPEHETNRTLTVSVLYGEPTEHKNMGLDGALNLIFTDFQNYMNASKMRQTPQQQQMQSKQVITQQQQQQPVQVQASNSTGKKHPENIQIILNLLANNLGLTVAQYDTALQYLRQEKAIQLQKESGNTTVPDPEIEMQKKLINIMNRPSIAETHYDLLYPTVESLKDDIGVLELLSDVRVQKAMDYMMQNTNLIEVIENHMKF